MRARRPHALALPVLAAASALVLVAPGAAQADDREYVEDINSSGCGSSCVNWDYVESAGHSYDGTPEVLGADGKTCPGAAATVATATYAKTVGHSWSWDVGGGADATFLSKAKVAVSAKYSQSVSESVTNQTGINEPIPEGEIGHMVFIPKMYHSEGVMNWTEELYDEFNTTADFYSNVTSETPMTLENGVPSGVYDLDSRPMTTDEIAAYCS